MDKPELCRSRLTVVLAVLVFLPASAHAHTAIKGLGEVINGLIHPVLTPSHVLILLGLGLLAGQQVPRNLKTPMLVFLPLSAAALLLTMTGLVTTVYPPILICIALAAGAVVALEASLPRLVSMALFAAAAIAIGFDSAVETGSAVAQLKTLLGTWISLGLLVFDIAFYVSFLTKPKWQKIGVRVVGSWLIAISLLVLAFSLRRSGGG